MFCYILYILLFLISLKRLLNLIYNLKIEEFEENKIISHFYCCILVFKNQFNRVAILYIFIFIFRLSILYYLQVKLQDIKFYYKEQNHRKFVYINDKLDK